MSLLLPDTVNDKGLFGVGDGQVWQSPFRQWIYESGVNLDGTNVSAPPITVSGVLVEGAFRPTDDPEFGHTIDFLNGRIIFNNPQSLDLEVHADFSVREVRVDFEHSFNQQLQQGFLESKFFTNPITSFQLVYPSGAAQPFPAFFIEVDDRTFDGFELGNRSSVISDTVKLHVWALDDLTRDNIVDVLSSQWRKKLPIIDFNRAPLPLSGLFNTLSNEYVPYQLLVKNNEVVSTIGSGVPVRYISYIEDVTVQNLPSVQEYERAMVTFEMKTYLNAPITPFGDAFDPIRVLPTINDTGGI